MIVLGSLPPDAVRQVLTDSFDVQADSDLRTVLFTWLDEATCVPSALHAALITDSYVLVAAADRIDALDARIRQNSTSSVPGFDAVDGIG